MGDIYPKAVGNGDIIVVGSLDLQPQEGWIYPPYMAEKCPGLPAYEALYDCAQAFAAAQPILMMMWQPHWVFAETEVDWVEWDAPHGECNEVEQARGEACGFQ
ncbi:MAG: hypothetical protein GDA36_00155 [Rhodobacteraceae bacterium]|nr:hypothetical protein [Paracoccaceae bacterium]